MASKSENASPKMRSFLDKVGKKTKIKYKRDKVRTADDIGKNPNGAFTSNGSMNQGYKTAKQAAADGTYKSGFTATSTSTRQGRLAVDLGNGKTDSKSAQTWSFDLPKDERTDKRKNGRGNIVNRSKRGYDVRVGLNNDRRSLEAINRLRAMGLTDEEIGVGGKALSVG